MQKGLLTKALNSVKSSKDEFCPALEGSSVLTIKRKAEHLVDRVSNVTVRKSQLEDAYDNLVVHCYELNETDFEPVTAPQIMAEHLNKQMSEYLNMADTTMARYEDKIREAEAYLSGKEPPPLYLQLCLLPQPPQQPCNPLLEQLLLSLGQIQI